MIQLQQGTIIKQLKTAGVQITATAEQARSLSALKSLITISDAAQSTVDESQTNTQEVQELISKISSQEDCESKDAPSESAAISAESEELKAEIEEEDKWEDYENPRSKTLRAKKVVAEKEAVGLYGKFVNVTDVLPPLPKKGDFKVENIKKSLYFFS